MIDFAQKAAELRAHRAAQKAAHERATAETAGPAQVVAAVATGSVAGDAPPQPKPLMCRLAALMQEWRTTRDNMKARGEDDAAIAVECCMEMLHEDVTAYLKEMKDFKEHSAKPQNTEIRDARSAFSVSSGSPSVK